MDCHRIGEARGMTKRFARILSTAITLILLHLGAGNVFAGGSQETTDLLKPMPTRQGDDSLAWICSASPEGVQASINKGADVNARYKDRNERNMYNGETVLMIAAEFNPNPEVITILVKAGADVNALNKDGATALMKAALLTHNPEVIVTLLNAGADAGTEQNTRTGPQTALSYADFENPYPWFWRRAKNANAAYQKLKKATDDALAPKRGLFELARNGTAQDVQSAISKGADVNARGAFNRTPLMEAAVSQSLDVINILVSAHADVTAREWGGSTALIDAASSNSNPEVIIALLNAGADINARTDTGYTPLMYAASSNRNPEVIAALLKAGADVNATMRAGLTALSFARKYNPNPAIAQRLMAGGAVEGSEQTTQTDGSNSGSLMGAFSSILSSVGQATGNKVLQDLATATSDVQEISDIASGKSDSGATDRLQAGSASTTNPRNSTPAANSFQGKGAAQGGPYNGPGATTVHNLLGLPTVKPYIRSWNPPAPQLPPVNSQREALIAAAIEDAWGAEAEARAGRPKVAEQLAVVMHENLQNAYSLRSTSPLPIGDVGSTTAPDPISDGDLRALLDAY